MSTSALADAQSNVDAQSNEANEVTNVRSAQQGQSRNSPFETRVGHRVGACRDRNPHQALRPLSAAVEQPPSDLEHIIGPPNVKTSFAAHGSKRSDALPTPEKEGRAYVYAV